MPTKVRRSIIAGLLAVVALASFGLVALPDGPSGQPVDEIIEAFSPGPNDKIPRQGQVRVALAVGWAGRLRIDQIDIPDDQARADVGGKDVASKQNLVFQPAAGKALTSFVPGQNCVVLTYWQVETGPSQSFTKNWCFTAV